MFLQIRNQLDEAFGKLARFLVFGKFRNILGFIITIASPMPNVHDKNGTFNILISICMNSKVTSFFYS